MRIAPVLSLVVLLGAVAAGQSNPYPSGCYSFITEEVDCSDYDQGSCKGKLDQYTDINGAGTQDLMQMTLQCNNSCGAPSPSCPACNSQGPFLVASPTQGVALATPGSFARPVVVGDATVPAVRIISGHATARPSASFRPSHPFVTMANMESRPVRTVAGTAGTIKARSSLIRPALAFTSPTPRAV